MQGKETRHSLEVPMPPQPLHERVIEAVLAFVNAQSWVESKEIVEARRDELLTEAANQVFAALLAQYSSDESAIHFLEERRALLTHCRQEGDDDAFDRVRPRETSVLTPQLRARLMAVHSAEELRQLVEEHPEVVPVLQQMATEAQASQRSPAPGHVAAEFDALLDELPRLIR